MAEGIPSRHFVAVLSDYHTYLGLEVNMLDDPRHLDVIVRTDHACGHLREYLGLLREGLVLLFAQRLVVVADSEDLHRVVNEREQGHAGETTIRYEGGKIVDVH